MWLYCVQNLLHFYTTVKMVCSVASFKSKRDSFYFCSSIKVYIVWFSYTTIFGYLQVFYALSYSFYVHTHLDIYTGFNFWNSDGCKDKQK